MPDRLAEPITAVVERALYASHECGSPIGTMTYTTAFIDNLATQGYVVAEAVGVMSPATPTDEQCVALAKLFHDEYESLAADFDYKTRDASAVPWDRVPENNRNLMRAVSGRVLSRLFPDGAPDPLWPESDA